VWATKRGRTQPTGGGEKLYARVALPSHRTISDKTQSDRNGGAHLLLFVGAQLFAPRCLLGRLLDLLGLLLPLVKVVLVDGCGACGEIVRLVRKSTLWHRQCTACVTERARAPATE
jgi:hypothetical protein